jgi:hypothetical protein
MVTREKKWTNITLHKNAWKTRIINKERLFNANITNPVNYIRKKRTEKSHEYNYYTIQYNDLFR